MNTRIGTPTKPPFTTTSAISLQRKCACGGSPGPSGECAECRKKRTLQRSAAASSGPELAPPIVHHALRSPGQPLEPAIRSSMELRFGHDFSRVRVHTDARASESAHAVNALAYTVGRDVVFGPGQYVPETTHGKRLLAHELTHVLQQGDRPWAGSSLTIGRDNDASEREAKDAAESSGGAPHISLRSSTVQRLQGQMTSGSSSATSDKAKRKCSTSGFGEFTYGCYCGQDTAPGCEDFQCEAYDPLDECCRQHDIAYGNCTLLDTLIPLSRCSLIGTWADLALCACAATAPNLKEGGEAFRKEVKAFFCVVTPLIRTSPLLLLGQEWLLMDILEGLALPPRVKARGRKLLTQMKASRPKTPAAQRPDPGAPIA